jgi:hypothetical protein
MKQYKIHKKPREKNIYEITGLGNYSHYHNEYKDAGTKPVPKFLQKENAIINEREGIL